MMRRALHTAGCVALVCGPAVGSQPRMGGEMNHVLVSVYQKTVYVSIERPWELPLTLYDYGEVYDGPASVLNGSAYNGQFGWLANGFINLPADATMWVEPVEQTDGLRTHAQGTFEPILGTDGSPVLWEWNGTMVHNWTSAFTFGDYSATYRVLVGYADGTPYPGYTPGEITLAWSYPCDADFNGDTVINSLDFIAYLNAYIANDPKADFNGDTVINSLDFIAFLSAYVAGCP